MGEEATSTSTPVPRPTQQPIPTARPTATPTPTPAFTAPTPEGLIAFYSRRDGNYEIYVMNSDGSGQTNLTNNNADDYVPVWSPDGARIAFRSNRDGKSEIYVMNANGSGQDRVTEDTATDGTPYWSPDSSRIAFASKRDGNSEIYVVNANGSGHTNLTNNSAEDYFPVWSPDGSRIAFASKRDGNREIYVMYSDGSGQTNLTNNGAEDYLTDWSPDGSRIAFYSKNRTSYGKSEIYVMNSDGSGQINLTNGPQDYFPAWSPDGSGITFTSTRVGNHDIYVMSADGSGQTNLTSNNSRNYFPDWSQPTTPAASSTAPAISTSESTSTPPVFQPLVFQQAYSFVAMPSPRQTSTAWDPQIGVRIAISEAVRSRNEQGDYSTSIYKMNGVDWDIPDIASALSLVLCSDENCTETQPVTGESRTIYGGIGGQEEGKAVLVDFFPATPLFGGSFYKLTISESAKVVSGATAVPLSPNPPKDVLGDSP